jgi:O-antigen/teichoic acid export membrane protein
MRHLFSFSFYISTITILMTLVVSVDRMIIPGRLSTAALGIYSSGFIIITIPKILTNAVSTALVPYISEGSADRFKAKSEFLSFFLLFSVIAALGYGVFILGLAPLSKMFLPLAYQEVKSILWILLIGSFFSDISNLNTSFIASAGKTYELRNLSIILVVTLAINIFLNLVFIPQHGIAGAAFANLISFGFAGLLTSLQVLFFPDK